MPTKPSGLKLSLLDWLSRLPLLFTMKLLLLLLLLL